MSRPPIQGELVVVALKAEKLEHKSPMKQDPFCIFRVGDIVKRTKTDHGGGLYPIWDDQVNIPVTGNHYHLHIQIFDKTTQPNNLMAEGTVDLAKVFRDSEHDGYFPLLNRGRPSGVIYLELTFYSAINQARPQQQVRNQYQGQAYRPQPPPPSQSQPPYRPQTSSRPPPLQTNRPPPPRPYPPQQPQYNHRPPSSSYVQQRPLPQTPIHQGHPPPPTLQSPIHQGPPPSLVHQSPIHQGPPPSLVHQSPIHQGPPPSLVHQSPIHQGPPPQHYPPQMRPSNSMGTAQMNSPMPAPLLSSPYQPIPSPGVRPNYPPSQSYPSNQGIPPAGFHDPPQPVYPPSQPGFYPTQPPHRPMPGYPNGGYPPYQ